MGVNWEELSQTFMDYLLEEETDQATQLARDTLAGGETPGDFFSFCITPALVEIGSRFERLEIFLPEMVFAAEIVQEVNDTVIQPHIEASGGQSDFSLGKVLLATVEGDLHDIGKNIVGVMLSVNGFTVIDMGVDVSPAAIVEKAEQEEVDIIGMSSLLTGCLPFMQDVVGLLEAKRDREKYAVIIGGAAPTDDFAKSIRVDAHGHSSAEAVSICRSIMKDHQ